MLLRYCFFGLLASVASGTIDKAFIVELESSSSRQGRSTGPHNAFHKRAEASLDYTVRHTFNSPGTYVGVSVQVNSDGTNEELKARLEAIPGVIAVSQIQRIHLPVTVNTSADPLLSFSNPGPLQKVQPGGAANLASPLQMGGVDKLHAVGIKGKGIKIGIVDTGVDYRHPALGGGFGPGFKIEGGWAFVDDNGATVSSPDPLATCYGGGHGTHVAGIVGMEPVTDQFDITGVAPEASIYAYRALDCTGHGGSDNAVAAVLKAQADGVDIVSMSIGFGPASFLNAVDPLQDVSNKLSAAGIAIIVAAANDGIRGTLGNNLYTVESPSSISSNIAVGSTAIKDFPLVYSAVDSSGAVIKYATVFPLDYPDGADVILLDDGCDSDNWIAAMNTVQDINNTIVILQISGNGACTYSGISLWNSASQTPVVVMAYNSNETDPYLQTYNSPSQGYFGSVQFTNVDNIDGAILAANYAAAGGYLKYKLTFPDKSYQSVPAASGGYMDWYSSWGPTWHDYGLKPQFSAPGGHALSTWPLGVLGGWCILSGTSMATPYASASYALVKSQFPSATVSEVINLLQTNASPLQWIYDQSIVAATAQQGAGALNVYNAIFSKSAISPGQITVSDVTHTTYGTGNFTIKNRATSSKSYTIQHQGAGYGDYRLTYKEASIQANYGSATFSKPSITIPAGKSATITFNITPPTTGVSPEQLPVFGGFIEITSSSGEAHSIPYIGPPYSLYNTPYIQVTTTGTILPQFQGHINGSIVVNSGFQEVNPLDGFGSAIPTLQWTTEARIDVLPANTTISANNYGFSITAAVPTYQASQVVPTESVFGFPSFGTLLHSTAYNWPTNFGVQRSDTLVTKADGTTVAVGDGDYRWYVSILKWGGVSGVKADYDTWLGPIIRFVDS